MKNIIYELSLTSVLSYVKESHIQSFYILHQLVDPNKKSGNGCKSIKIQSYEISKYYCYCLKYLLLLLTLSPFQNIYNLLQKIEMTITLKKLKNCEFLEDKDDLISLHGHYVLRHGQNTIVLDWLWYQPGFFREIEPIEYIQIKHHYEELIHVLMEVENSHNLLYANWSPRRFSLSQKACEPWELMESDRRLNEMSLLYQ